MYSKDNEIKHGGDIEREKKSVIAQRRKNIPYVRESFMYQALFL